MAKFTVKTLLATALTLAIMTSSAPSGSNAAAVGSSRRGATKGRKVFSAQKVREMVRERLKQQKMELWERLMESRSSAHRKGAEHHGRPRRAAPEEVEEVEEKLVLSLEQEDTLVTFISEVVSCQDIPGMSLGMVKNGVRQAMGIGLGNMETASSVDSHTLMGIGSNTKAFAAATMAKLMVDQPADKKLYFSTPLSELMEDFKLPDDTRTRLTTLQDVLSHRTGLGSADLGIFAGYPANFTAKDMCRRLKFLPEVVPFRSDWHYSNTLLVLVAHLCETVSGDTWENLVSDLLFQPLGMNASFFLPDAMWHDNVALPYILRMDHEDLFVQQDESLFDIHPLEAAGAIASSADDMTKFLAYMLEVINRPKDSNMYLLRRIFREHILMPSYLRQLALTQEPVPVLHVGYAMGFITSYYKDHLIHWHTGDNHGYASYMIVVPKMETAVYVAVNGPSKTATSQAVKHIAFYVLELLQGNNPWVNVTLACPEGYDDFEDESYVDYDYNDDYPGDDAQEVNANTQKLLRPIEDYLGVYGHGLLGDLAIVREEERNSLMRLELGRHLVADLIPTESESVFKVAARTPVADTKEWEQEHAITFWPISASKASSKSSSTTTTNATAVPTKVEEETEEEEEKKTPFDEIRFRWGLETYSFKKSVRFDTALDEEGEEGSEPEHGDEGNAGSNDGSGPHTGQSVGDNGAARAGDASCVLASFLTVLGVMVSQLRLC